MKQNTILQSLHDFKLKESDLTRVQGKNKDVNKSFRASIAHTSYKKGNDHHFIAYDSEE